MRINQLPLTKDEKVKIINYKPRNIVDLSIVSNCSFQALIFNNLASSKSR